MNKRKLFYIGLPQFISFFKHLSSSSTIHSRGISFKLTSDNWITKYRARTFNDKEPKMLDWLDANLQDGDVFFDVGANVGIYSIYAALRNSRTKVYSFEPEYSNLGQLKKNIIINHLNDNIIPFSIAFSHQRGISYLHLQDLTPGSAMHTESRNNLDKSYGKNVVWREGIVTYTIDEFCNSADINPSLVKIDVDGNELEILKGGQITFSNPDLRTIYIEVNSSQLEFERIFHNYGFEFQL
jgi:FkbM family methyltransferase